MLLCRWMTAMSLISHWYALLQRKSLQVVGCWRAAFDPCIAEERCWRIAWLVGGLFKEKTQDRTERQKGNHKTTLCIWLASLASLQAWCLGIYFLPVGSSLFFQADSICKHLRNCCNKLLSSAPAFKSRTTCFTGLMCYTPFLIHSIALTIRYHGEV